MCKFDFYHIFFSKLIFFFDYSFKDLIKFFTRNNANDCNDAAYDLQVCFQDPASPSMEGIIDFHHDLFFYIVFIAIFVTHILNKVIEGYNFYNLDVMPGEVEHNSFIEIVWTLIPAVILAIVAVSSLALLYSLDEVVKPFLTIKVIGHQWYWHYEYFLPSFGTRRVKQETPLAYITEGLNMGFRLLEAFPRPLIPFSCYTNLLVSSADVLHSWCVPSLGIKIDACPGRLNQVMLFPKRRGAFFGQCSEICGVNHGFMPIALNVEDIVVFLVSISRYFLGYTIKY